MPRAKKAVKEPKLTPKAEESRLENKSADLPPAVQNEDYLRKYQYRKQVPFGSVGSDPQPGSKAAIMKKVLLEQPKVRMFIPKISGEDISVAQSVTLNGYRLDLPKQTYLDVPQQIAEVLMESLKQTEEAVQRNLISGDKDKENALL